MTSSGEDLPDHDAFAAWVAQQRWTEAKTMPTIPHEYTVVHWKDPEAAKAAGRYIRKHGYKAKWKNQSAKPYYDLGPHRYWVIWPVINRCLLPEYGGVPANDVVKVPPKPKLDQPPLPI